MTKPSFTIIYDTYCGWCYGAAPIFDALIGTDAQVDVLHRHLFQGPLAYKMSKGKGALVLQADARIQDLTGQEFSDIYKENVVLSDTEVLASHYTAQAAALVHDQGAKAEFALRKRLEHDRYIKGNSASNRDAVIAALVDAGVQACDAAQIGTPALAAQAEQISAKASDLMSSVGSHGVPTVLRHQDGETTQVDHSAFYKRPNAVTSLLT